VDTRPSLFDLVMLLAALAGAAVAVWLAIGGPS
jgi:hypothetical protein